MKRILLKFIIWTGCLGAVVGIFFGMYYSYKIRLATVEYERNKLEYVDAKGQYKKTAKILKQYDAGKSKSNISEGSAKEKFEEKGFGKLEYHVCYDKYGNYIKKDTINETHKKYPSYTAEYISKKNEAWSVIIQDGHTFAYPLSYTLSEKATVPVIVSETDYVIGYDGPTNTFFKIIPKASSGLILTVDHIDAATLDKLTVKEIISYAKKNKN